ncbi:ras family-domain-containing protein [Xylariomycetidae sp. FL2044]|nr:ras family-domain-containing protein [Xylariomycetidae sp. FL2044]
MAGKLPEIRIVVLGDGGVGKTSLTTQLCLSHFVQSYDPTLEDSARKQCMIDNKGCILDILDTAGQEEYSALRDQWIRAGEGFLLVYSITSRSSFTTIRKYHQQIRHIHPVAPILLAGNKVDRVTEREISTQEATALAQELGCAFIETSAKTALNVETAFYNVVRILRKQQSDLLSDTGRPRKDSYPYPMTVGQRKTSLKDKLKAMFTHK